MMKTCNRCKKHQPFSNFSPRKDRKNGHRSYCKPCSVNMTMEQDSKNPKAKKGRWIKYAYGLSYNEYTKMLQKQNNVCAICFESEINIDPRTKEIRNLAVDHCHISGKIRGLLCARCNTTLGKCEENISILENAIKYLKQHSK